jgi:hypothetical protein
VTEEYGSHETGYCHSTHWAHRCYLKPDHLGLCETWSGGRDGHMVYWSGPQLRHAWWIRLLKWILT